MSSRLVFVTFLLAIGCGASQPGPPATNREHETPLDARRGFTTRIVTSGEPAGAPEQPDGREFDLVHYPSAVGRLAAYLTPDPVDGKRHPAIVWITGGDCNSIGDVWTPQDRSNDQTASAFRKAGIVMLFPSQRGGNDNPGEREGFYGEVDDILAATDYLAKLPYVDPDQIYLGGHSTGGTLAMLVAECTDRYRAVFALGPVASPAQYGGAFIYCDPNDEREILLRSPIAWLDGVRTPLYVFEGGIDGNWKSCRSMAESNANPLVKFYPAPGHNHFSIVAPLAELLAGQILRGRIEISPQMLYELE
jgi:pimeloyl-ACP methyl ester carboxylesterase